MIAVDTSILAFAANRFAPEHTRASRLLEQLVNGEAAWALPWPVVHEFVQLVTHPHAVARPLRAADAEAFVDRLLASPSVHVLGPTEAHADVLFEVVESADAALGLPEGLDTAVVLREHGVRELLSADRGMRRFAFLTVIDPLHGPAWELPGAPARRYRKLTARVTPDR